MRVQAIIVKDISINGSPVNLPGLKLLKLRNMIETVYNPDELYLSYYPEIIPFDCVERPHTVTLDSPLRILCSE